MKEHKSSSFNEDGSSRVREKWERGTDATATTLPIYTHFRRDRLKWEP